MASISGRGAKGHHTYNLTLTQASQSIANNESTVNYSFELIDDSNWFWEQWGNSITYSISANSSVIASGSIPNHTTKNQTIASGSFTVPHNTDGSKSISYSFSVDDNANQYYTSGDASASGTLELTKIPRYLTINSFNITNITETTAIVNWSVSDPRSSTYYSLDGGNNWIGSATYGETLASDGKSGSFNINGLTAGTNYDIKIKIKRTDSGLWTESSSKSIKTYNYPYCTSAPSFKIGDQLRLEFYNPLNRTIQIQMWSFRVDQFVSDLITTSGTSYTGFSDVADRLYASIPNNTDSGFNIDVHYGGNKAVNTFGTTYSIKGTEVPTVGSISYKDSNQTTVNITEDNQRIIRNNSNLVFTLGTATAKNSASISNYEVTIGGITKSKTSAGDLDFGTINLSRDTTATLKVTDSRGLSSTSQINVIFDDWVLPNALISLNRKNNYYSETYLKVDASISSLNSKNSMTIQYQYKKVSDGNYSELVSLSDNVQVTLDFDNNYQWDIKVFVSDRIGTTTYNLVLDRGMPIVFFDRLNNSVGINNIPKNTYAFEVNGNTNELYSNGKDIRELPTGEDTRDYWNHLPNGIYWYGDTGAVPNLPTRYAWIWKIGYTGNGDFSVLYFEQAGGTETRIFRKSGNAHDVSGWYNIFEDDTGWVDMSAYINTEYFSARDGMPPMARRIGNKVYWKGFVYCTKEVGSKFTNILYDLPSWCNGVYEYGSGSVQFDHGNVYFLYIEEYTVRLYSVNDITPTSMYQGFNLTNISGYLTD